LNFRQTVRIASMHADSQVDFMGGTGRRRGEKGKKKKIIP